MQLIYSLQIGGSEKLAFDIASHLDPARFHFTVCAMDLGGNLTEELDRKGIAHHIMHRQGFEAGVYRRLFSLIRDRHIDIVHTHHFTQLFYGALPARLAGARVVHTEHEFFSYVQSALARRLIRPLSRLCDGMTVVGPEVAEYFIRTAGLPESRITVVPNGVDVEAFDYDRHAARRALGIGEHDVVVGTVGRLEPEKDQATLLEVFRRVAATNPSARLVIVGGGSLEDSLRARAADIGVADRTRFLGVRRDVAQLLAAMDVFVLTSIREGLPISLIEAMAARLPIVTSDVGSIAGLVQHERHGFVLRAGDTNAFADAIQRLLQSADLRNRLGQNGRRTVEASFSLSAMVRSYEDLYAAAMRQSNVRN